MGVPGYHRNNSGNLVGPDAADFFAHISTLAVCLFPELAQKLIIANENTGFLYWQKFFKILLSHHPHTGGAVQFI